MKSILSLALALLATAANAGAIGTVLINEFAPNPDGGDPSTTTVELLGTPGASFSGSLVFIESDPGGSNPGDINNFFSVSGTFDSNGLLAASIGDPENPAFTLVLTSSFTGDLDTDVDADDDGTPEDLSTFGDIYDAIGVPDDADNDILLYGANLGGTDLAFNGQFEPLLVFREKTTGELFNTVTVNFGQPDQYIGVFDAAGVEVDGALFTPNPTLDVTFDTFGEMNPAFIPEPASIALVLLCGTMAGAVSMRSRLG